MGLEHPAITRTNRTGYPEPEPEVVGTCEGCGEDIYEDEDVYDYDGMLIHQDSSCCADYIANNSICRTA